MILDEQALDEIIDLLTPLAKSEGERRALLQRCCPALAERVDFDGSTNSFLSRLVGQLAEYGEIKSGSPALAALLESAREQVGTDQQARIDALLAGVYRQALSGCGGRLRYHRIASFEASPLFDPETAILLIDSIRDMDANGGLEPQELLDLKRQYPSYDAVIQSAIEAQAASARRRIVDEQQMQQARTLSLETLICELQGQQAEAVIDRTLIKDQIGDLGASVGLVEAQQFEFSKEQLNCGVRRNLASVRSQLMRYWLMLLFLTLSVGVTVVLHLLSSA